MRSALVWWFRLCALAGWAAAAVACAWLLGATALPRPWTEAYGWGAVAVGCAVGRVLALWRLRVLREEGRPPVDPTAPSSPADRRAASGPASLSEALGFSFSDLHGSRVWIRARTLAVWALVAFASGSFLVALLASSNSGEKLDALRKAGAVAGTATVVGEPHAVREELTDEGAVKGYASRLVVAVPGGPERLTVRGAYTYERPRGGTEVDVLWAASAPELGGYVNESKDLESLARGRWDAFPDDEAGRGALITFIAVAVVFGGVLGTVFSLSPPVDALRRLAVSPGHQTVRAASAVVAFAAWSPLILGHGANPAHLLLAAGGSLLVPLAYVSTAVRFFR